MKMQHLFTCILIFCFIDLAGQEQTLKPGFDQPVWFDISPPLRDMVMIQPEKADKSWKNGIVRNFFFPENEENKDFSSPVSDPGLQGKIGSLLTDTTVMNFEGLSNNGGYNPPDTDGDVGPGHYFQVVNCSFAIFNKTGEKIFGPVTNSSIWNGLPNNTNSGDAVVLYDEVANRWFFSQFSFPNFPSGPYFQMIAVSQTPDPTGSWYRWQYEFTTMNDYPKFGIWPDGYYMSCNHINTNNSTFIGAGIYAYNRSAMLAGDPGAGRISFLIPASTYGSVTMLPSDCDGSFPPAGTPCYFAYIKTTSPQHLGVYEFHTNWTTPSGSTLGNNITLSVNPFSTFTWFTGIAQMGTSSKLDAISDRLMHRLQYRRFSGYSAMVVNHTVNAGSNISGIRWYELRNSGSGWGIYQQSTYAPADSKSRWMGSMAMDTAGSIALGYSISGSSLYPGIRYTGRVKNDPLNQMTISERIIFNGSGSQQVTGAGTGRWGDYSTMRTDPSSPTTFWYSTEYFATNSPADWKTRIASFTFGNTLSSYASSEPATICVGDSSRLNAVAYGGSSSYTYSWTSIPPGFTSTQQNPVVYPLITTNYFVTINDGIHSRTDSTMVKVINPPEVFAGNDTTVCLNVSQVELHGTAENYRILAWISTGDGTFADNTLLNTSYFPGWEDKANGSVDLKLRAFPNPPSIGNVTSTKHLIFDPCTGSEDMTNKEPVVFIHPNPAEKVSILTLLGIPDHEVEIQLLNGFGQLCYRAFLHGCIGKTRHVIDLDGLAKGCYFVHVKTNSVFKVVKLIVS